MASLGRHSAVDCPEVSPHVCERCTPYTASNHMHPRSAALSLRLRIWTERLYILDPSVRSVRYSNKCRQRLNNLTFD